MRFQSLSSERGASILSVMIAIGITLTFTLVIASFLTSAFRIQKNAQLVSNQVDLLNEVRAALESGPSSNCTQNIKRAIQARVGATGKMDLRDAKKIAAFPIKLSYFEHQDPPLPAPKVVRDLLETGMTTEGGLRVVDLKLQPRAWIGTRKALLELQVRLEKTGDFAGMAELPSRTIPIFAMMDDAGNFVSCGTDGMASQEKLCVMMGAGEYIYNTATQKCVSRYKLEYFPGTVSQSSCPYGELVPENYLSCKISNVVGEPPAVWRQYGDFSWKQPFSNWLCKAEADNKRVTCVPRDDLVRGPGSICSAGCKVTDPQAAYDPNKK